MENSERFGNAFTSRFRRTRCRTLFSKIRKIPQLMCKRKHYWELYYTCNYFHLLRRQQKFPFRKPLVVMTPKSLLRHPRVISTVEELANGSFQPVIDDATAQTEKVEKLVFCSGKLYYELLAKKEELNDDKVALVRIEQLYPLNPEIIQGIFDKYSNRKNLFGHKKSQKTWELGRICCVISHNENIQVIAPVASGTPTPGTHKNSRKPKGVINRVFGVSEENVDLVRPITTVND